MAQMPRVCVIGAGVSGLTACKSLSDFGVPHVCFEASDEVGGNWYFQNPNGVSSAYRCTSTSPRGRSPSGTSRCLIATRTTRTTPTSSSGCATTPTRSTCDIVSELGRKTVSEMVYLSTRSGAYVIPKYLFGKPADQIVKTNPMLPAGLQRRLGRVLPRIFSGRMEDFGQPTPNHNFLDAHPTVSSELLGRLGVGDAVAKGDVAELLGDRVRFADGSVEPVDAIVYATGYRVSFPFFDPDFLSAPENVLPLYKRMLKPGLDGLAFIGLGQPIPTSFPFAELQSKLAARWLSGDWAPPAPAEMEREIAADEAFHTAHFVAKPRHTMQLEWYSYKRELEHRTIPAGQARARAGARTGRDTAGRSLDPSGAPA